MRGFLAVVRRELVERRFILAAAAGVSLIPFVPPLVRGMSGLAAQQVRGEIALFACVAFAMAVAAMLGTASLAPALASRPLAFDFARPLSAAAIWGGRLAAALFLALASAALVGLPTRLAGPLLPGDLFAATDLP